MKILPVEKIAAKLKINKKYILPYGKYSAKIDLAVLKEISRLRRRGKYILVTAITPTPLGEGKTVTTIGLSMALNRMGKKACACIRQPSLGPVFGIKGGGAGGGASRLVPTEDINLHFTGDFHAVSIAHNLAAAFLDNSIFRGNSLNINPAAITWRRAIDVNDRSLRDIRACLNEKEEGPGRDSGFDITAASEIMAILALSEGLTDMRKRLGRIVLADKFDGAPVTAEEIKVAGSMAALLKDAIKPNLVQTVENTPCFVHTGPFGNIAHGNSSIIADRIALSFCDYVVTEAGFGADCGAENFFNIKCRVSGLVPDAVVLVCSVRALKAHSGKFSMHLCKALDKGLVEENIPALEQGLCNLKKQIANVKAFGVPVVVAINRFASDTDKEIKLIRERSIEFGAVNCQVSQAWSKGSRGSIDLAKSVVSASKIKKDFKFLYPLDMPIKEKIKVIATRMYGARAVEYSALAEERINAYNRRGWDKLPVCMAKTQLSLSHDPHLLGEPKDFVLPVRDVRASIGAGFLYPLCGKVQTMPGLPACPAGENIDIDEEGNVTGLH
ncbi:MAG: formate--tetrahydrofolate ligase [Candidatus Omnitrophota bacterium]